MLPKKLPTVKKITKMQYNLAKIVLFSSKIAILNQFFSYKLCVTEKRTYVNKLKFPNGFVVNGVLSICTP